MKKAGLIGPGLRVDLGGSSPVIDLPPVVVEIVPLGIGDSTASRALRGHAHGFGMIAGLVDLGRADIHLGRPTYVDS